MSCRDHGFPLCNNAIRPRDSFLVSPKPPARETADRGLEGKRILMVEDEPLLAMDIAAVLEDVGAQVVGPAASVAEALSLMEKYCLHAVLLDTNLDGAPVDEIAAALVMQDMPFAFLSGYGRETLPIGFGDSILLLKPCHARQLLETLRKLVL